ncbi:transcription factor whiB [Caudoviricetes sp.]|nr:transcription factor whiB [Caudoviricetes sp.]
MREDWASWSLCLLMEIPPSKFYSYESKDIAFCRNICIECEVREDCLQAALDNNEEGFWGGYTQAEREALSLKNFLQGGLQAFSQRNIPHEQLRPQSECLSSPLDISGLQSHIQQVLSQAAVENTVSVGVRKAFSVVRSLLVQPSNPNQKHPCELAPVGLENPLWLRKLLQGKELPETA